jgi:serine/threonine protein kinase
VTDDSGLGAALSGATIPSETDPSVLYRLVYVLGDGGMGVAFYAIRESRDGITPAVLKVVRPEIVSTAGGTAQLMIQKEAIALGRLNERVPSTPFVVRFLDTGTVMAPFPRPIGLPWIALEHVHGGDEGTTLLRRVDYAVKNTQYAFDAQRVAHNVECLAQGLTAIHDVDVVHRDITPGNVLCCGFGVNEVPKIADFGIARPTGIHATFGSVMLGTPGYAAPEQSFPSEGDIGPWTDVFSFACLVYFMLTGEAYFATANFGQALLMARAAERRPLLGASTLSPELRESRSACEAIDLVLARATSLAVKERFPTAEVFASAILPALRAVGGPRSQRASERLVASIASRPFSKKQTNFEWTVRHPPGDDRLVRSTAWDASGHCLAVTTEGLHYWNGTRWLTVRSAQSGEGSSLQTVSLVRPGQWLVAGQQGHVALVGTEGRGRAIAAPGNADFTLASGDPEDLALLVAEGGSGAPLLYSAAAGHFFRPVPLEFARSVSGIARIEETRWLIAGRSVHGKGFLALYSALDFDVTLLTTEPTDALTTTAANVDRGIGVAAGRRGVVVRVSGAKSDSTTLGGFPDLASSAIDIQGRVWTGATGQLWTCAPEPDARWSVVWEDPAFAVPFVSIRAEVGVVTALTVDGAVLEGRTG